MTAHSEHGGSVLKSWLVVFLLLVFILFKGGLAYYVIGDLGQPDWDYRPIPDVPGESGYANYDALPYSQHVLGTQGE